MTVTVRNVRKELLQLRCPINVELVVKLPMPETSGKFRNSLPLGLGTGAERPQTCGVPPFKASLSWKALNSLPLVSLDALTALAVKFANCTHAI